MSIPQQPTAPSRRQTKVGRVVSNKMQKTIVVTVDTLKKHPVYKKSYRWTKRYKVHDEENTAQVGDLVRIEETRPLSKEKRWQLIEIIQHVDSAPTVAQVSSIDVREKQGGKKK
jgi:small subunit ribosomal protein S17